jgi:vacuolar-type H+-ATPase subunit I/STV1
MVPVTFLYKMIFTSSAFISAERASVAYDDSAVLPLNTLDAMIPARDDLVRSVNACQRADAALLLVEVATSALDEITEGDIPQGSVGQKDEMEFLQEIQQRDNKLMEMNVRCEEAEAMRQEAENTALEMSVRCEEAEALRQEAENAVLEMSMRCEEAERMRSECEHVLRIGAEQEERIALFLEEIARMQKERIESAADDAKDLAGNLRKEISELQAKYEQTRESPRRIQSRLESIQEIHKSVGCQSEEDARTSNVVLRDCRN